MGRVLLCAYQTNVEWIELLPLPMLFLYLPLTLHSVNLGLAAIIGLQLEKTEPESHECAKEQEM